MLDRELEARQDLGSTAVSRGVAAGLTAALLLLCVVPAALQVGRGGLDAAWRTSLHAGERVGTGLLAINRFLRRGLHDFELALEESSPVRAAFLPWEQWIETALLASGNRKVLIGRDGWLYFRPDLESLVVPGFLEPRPKPIGGQTEADVARTSGPQALGALTRLAEALRARDIALLVLVVPGKTAIEHPAAEGKMLRNASFERFAVEVSRGGATMLDATAMLAELRRVSSQPVYLHTDTHWRPQGMERVARAVAEDLRPRLPAGELELERRALRVEHGGDLWRALRLPARPALYREEAATIEQVLTATGDFLRPDRGADVLVMGDSFTNIYADPALGWGDGAGLAEQIAFHLRRPVDRLAITGGGPAAPLRELAAAATRGEDRLAGKVAVVYQIVAFELLSGDWNP